MRADLKSLGRKGCAGSTPAVRTSRRLHVRAGLPRTAPMTTQRTSKRLTSPKDLIETGLAGAERLRDLEAVAKRYAIGLTPALAALVEPGDPADPIARQFVPDPRELIRDPAERDDPIGDDAMSPVSGLVHRYPDRVLIKLVAVCAVYCRFCVRREQVGPGSGSLSAADFATAVDYVRAHQGIWEVILTGGDPLMLSPRRIAGVTKALAAIDHVKVLRWHTRLPVAAPEQVSKAVARALMAGGKTTVVAVHANHPRELTESARSACRRLAAEGAMLVSQSVLLKGVNDDTETLIDLMRAFVEARVKPYYLHHGDLAPGTTHWRVSVARGQELMRVLRARLSGLATPTYMLDIPGGHGKAPIGPQWIHCGENGEHVVTDPQGIQHVYADRLGADS